MEAVESISTGVKGDVTHWAPMSMCIAKNRIL